MSSSTISAWTREALVKPRSSVEHRSLRGSICGTCQLMMLATPGPQMQLATFRDSAREQPPTGLSDCQNILRSACHKYGRIWHGSPETSAKWHFGVRPHVLRLVVAVIPMVKGLYANLTTNFTVRYREPFEQGPSTGSKLCHHPLPVLKVGIRVTVHNVHMAKHISTYITTNVHIDNPVTGWQHLQTEVAEWWSAAAPLPQCSFLKQSANR